MFKGFFFFFFFTSSFTVAGLKSLSLKRQSANGSLAHSPVAPSQPAATERCRLICPGRKATWRSFPTATHSPLATPSMTTAVPAVLMSLHRGVACLKSDGPPPLPIRPGRGGSGQCLLAFTVDCRVARGQGGKPLWTQAIGRHQKPGKGCRVWIHFS